MRGTRASRSMNSARPAITPRCSPAVTSTCTVPVAWKSSRSSRGSVPRSPHSAPATTVASGSRNTERNRADNAARARAAHARTSCGSGGARATTRFARELAGEPFAQRDRAPRRFAGIARLIERHEPSAQHDAFARHDRVVANVRAHDDPRIERKRERRTVLVRAHVARHGTGEASRPRLVREHRRVTVPAREQQSGERERSRNARRTPRKQTEREDACEHGEPARIGDDRDDERNGWQ